MFTSDFDPIFCIEGEVLQLKCSVYADNIGVKWLKNKTEMKENEHISINWDGCNHLLTFKPALMNDSGIYSIVAGNVQKQFTVTMQGNRKRKFKEMKGYGVLCHTHNACMYIQKEGFFLYCC